MEGRYVRSENKYVTKQQKKVQTASHNYKFNIAFYIFRILEKPTSTN